VRSATVVIHRQVREVTLKAIELGYVPAGTGPGVGDGIGRFEAWLVRAISLVVTFNPIAFFSDSVVVEGDGVSPEEIFEVKRAGGYLMTFV
jgi:hypothetical protein